MPFLTSKPLVLQSTVISLYTDTQIQCCIDAGKGRRQDQEEVPFVPRIDQVFKTFQCMHIVHRQNLLEDERSASRLLHLLLAHPSLYLKSGTH